MKYYLAIDIGASSGRHILGWLEDGVLKTEEVYRFENNLASTEDGLVWDIDSLGKSVVAGLKRCGEIGKIPVSVAIDTWGVDYVLLDGKEQVIKPVYSYRNSRTHNIVEEVEKIISPEELYSLTGIQKQSFNTIYQLYCDKKAGRLEDASTLLMIPSYLSYLLCGAGRNEYTNATTSNLVNAESFDFDESVLSRLGYKRELFGDLALPGQCAGGLSQDIKEEVGFDCKVVFCPSHDTASAVAACPLCDNDVFISSGTWSLIGTELASAVTTEEARRANFANEGGIERRFRFLKNYMGMWLFQNIKRNLEGKYSYDDMMNMAMAADKYYYIDVNAPEFLAPESMVEAIKTHLGEPALPLDVLINSVYHSLAKSYRDAVAEIESVSGIKSEAIRIVGGGSKDGYLNRLCALYTGKKVTAGPTEGTAIGNLISQLMADNEGLTLADAREIIKKSFDIQEVKA